MLMRFLCKQGALVVLLAVLSLAAPAARAQDGDAVALQAVQAARQALASGDYVEAERLARPVTENRALAAYSAQVRDAAPLILIGALLGQRRCEEAEPAAERYALDRSDTALGWSYLFTAANFCDNFSRAAVALAHMARLDPESLAQWPDRMITQTAAWSRDPALLRHLVNGAWTPRERTTDLSNIRLAFIHVLLEARDFDQAREIATGLVQSASTDLGAVVVLFTDRRYERIVAADPQTFDFDTILSWQLSNARAAAAAEPHRSMAVRVLADTLLERGLYDETIALLDDALARPDDFTDIAEGRPWLLNLRSEALAAKGARSALEDLRLGAETPENGQPNVSQRLNYASSLVQNGRAGEALEQLEGFDTAFASGYGRMVLLQVKVCAYAQLGDEANMRAQLAEGIANRRDSLRQLYEMALCANDQPLARQIILEQLDHPTERRGVIVGLQEYLPQPLTPFDEQRAARDAAVKALPDVTRAIRRAATVRSFPIRRPWHFG